MATKYDLVIDQGATYVKQLTWYEPIPIPNPNNVKHGPPKDLTGFTGAMQAREDVTAAVILFNLTTNNGGLSIVGGVITIRIEAATTAAFDFDTAVYDLMLTAPDGTVTRLVEGKIKVSPDVTRL